MGPSWGSKEQPFHKSEHSVDVERSLFSKTPIFPNKSLTFWLSGVQIGASWATPSWARFMPEWDWLQNPRMGPAPNFSCAPRIDIKSYRNHIGSVSDRDRIGSHRDRIGSGWDRIGMGSMFFFWCCPRHDLSKYGDFGPQTRPKLNFRGLRGQLLTQRGFSPF